MKQLIPLLAVVGSLVVPRATAHEKRAPLTALHLNAVHVASGGTGYYVYVCRHVPAESGKWVQASKEIGSPYPGAAMPKCGALQE